MNNIVSRIRHHGTSKALKTAAIMLDGKGREIDTFNYSELDTISKNLAAKLQHTCKKGDRILLLYPSSLDFVKAFMACQYAGMVAVPVSMPSQEGAHLKRVNHVIEDASISLILTTEEWHKSISQWRDVSDFSTIPVIASNAAITPDNLQWQDPQLTSDDIAFLQYTSGSTGHPKGVVVSHGNLMHNSELMRIHFEQSEDTPIGGWLPFYHDMGLIAFIIQASYNGSLLVMMAPHSFIKRPLNWLKAISKYRLHTSGGPNFAYEHCINRIPDEQIAELDLSCWRAALNGAEPVRHETLTNFHKKFASVGFDSNAFLPCYGMAETTLYVAGNKPKTALKLLSLNSDALENGQILEEIKNAQSLIAVSCGNYEGLDLVIVDPGTCQQLNNGQVGEIWIHGDSVAQGYWNNTQLTSEIFHAQLADKSDKRWLRSGDLGFVLDQQLYITGRLKDLILINGRNIYPQDIEFHIKACDDKISKGFGAAFSIQGKHSEEVVLIQEVNNEVRSEVELSALVTKIRSEISRAFNVSVAAIVLIKRGTISRTTSGKIQRNKARQDWNNGLLKVIFQHTFNSNSRVA